MVIKLQNFHDKKMPKESLNNTCLAVITIDSILKTDANCCSQPFLKECQYIKKRSEQTYY